ncbi:hypothetical protein A1Q2_00121 [Trichosporon asahii var. asahii CBS 8904]|uniref:PHD-type domain-containing protein n=1 Tax=Trichosporon asahii var. asahii (strain CBS 8904) TaxID=1220162 RepID=K1WY40_TRIAC|nr:hypothetical protein A1Q2_00121 [Trichosporon asahii var. asahii CBS 8904]
MSPLPYNTPVMTRLWIDLEATHETCGSTGESVTASRDGSSVPSSRNTPQPATGAPAGHALSIFNDKTSNEVAAEVQTIVGPSAGRVLRERERNTTPSSSRGRDGLERSGVSASGRGRRVGGSARVANKGTQQQNNSGKGKGKAAPASENFVNQDFCSVCRGIGRFLCCDGCPRSFHFMCLEPPLRIDELPKEEVWYCRKCKADRAGTKGVDVIRAKDKPITTIFKTMAAKLDQDNPQQFRLPQEIRQYFNGVGTGAKGEYLDTESARNKYDRRVRGEAKERDPARGHGHQPAMAGHDINYLAVSGVLSMLGRAGDKPHPPTNILGDFAGGGAVLFQGILLALLSRGVSGKGQVVEANMVDGASYLSSMPRMGQKTPLGAGPRGTNMLDGGCPFYDTYETRDGKYVAVGSLEPQFFREMIKGTGLDPSWAKRQQNLDEWDTLRQQMTEAFKSKTRAEWEKIFDGTDACVTPVLEYSELEGKPEGDQRPIVTLRNTPLLAVTPGANGDPAKGQGPGVKGAGYSGNSLTPGEGGPAAINSWLGWDKGTQWEEVNGGYQVKQGAKL